MQILWFFFFFGYHGLWVLVCGALWWCVVVPGCVLFTPQCWVQASQLRATYTYGTHKITQVFFSTKVSFSGIVAGLFRPQIVQQYVMFRAVILDCDLCHSDFSFISGYHFSSPTSPNIQWINRVLCVCVCVLV